MVRSPTDLQRLPHPRVGDDGDRPDRRRPPRARRGRGPPGPAGHVVQTVEALSRAPPGAAGAGAVVTPWPVAAGRPWQRRRRRRSAGERGRCRGPTEVTGGAGPVARPPAAAVADGTRRCREAAGEASSRRPDRRPGRWRSPSPPRRARPGVTSTLLAAPVSIPASRSTRTARPNPLAPPTACCTAPRRRPGRSSVRPAGRRSPSRRGVGGRARPDAAARRRSGAVNAASNSGPSAPGAENASGLLPWVAGRTWRGEQGHRVLADDRDVPPAGCFGGVVGGAPELGHVADPGHPDAGGGCTGDRLVDGQPRRQVPVRAVAVDRGDARGPTFDGGCRPDRWSRSGSPAGTRGRAGDRAWAPHRARRRAARRRRDAPRPGSCRHRRTSPRARCGAVSTTTSTISCPPTSGAGAGRAPSRPLHGWTAIPRGAR